MDRIVDVVFYLVECLWFIDVSESPNKTKKWIRNSMYVVSCIALLYLIYLLMKD